MSLPMTIGQVLANCSTRYEKELLDRYFEIVLNEGEPDKQLVNEMFQIFDFLIVLRFGEVTFTREEI